PRYDRPSRRFGPCSDAWLAPLAGDCLPRPASRRRREWATAPGFGLGVIGASPGFPRTGVSGPRRPLRLPGCIGDARGGQRDPYGRIWILRQGFATEFEHFPRCQVGGRPAPLFMGTVDGACPTGPSIRKKWVSWRLYGRFGGRMVNPLTPRSSRNKAP